MLSQHAFATSDRNQAILTLLFWGGIIATAIAGVMRQGDGHLPVRRLASGGDRWRDNVVRPCAGKNGSRGGFGSRGLVTHLLWADTGVLLGALLAFTVVLTQLIENATSLEVLTPAL
ncbi:MAG: hypothetical protein JO069_07515 [Verrucomicrobia bacterium]|nr:hypothetical protein [Verrucomicrobiota bacterium]